MSKAVEETVDETTGAAGDPTIPEGYTAQEWADLSADEREGIAGLDDEGDDLDPDALLKIAAGGDDGAGEDGQDGDEPQETEESATDGDAHADDSESAGAEAPAEAPTGERVTDDELMGYRVESGKLELPGDVPAELQTKMDSLEDKFEAGELSAREYGRERDAINREITNAQLALAEDLRAAKTWEREQNVFLDARPEYLDDSVRGRMLYGALDATVRGLAVEPENQRLTGLQILVKADKLVKEAIGGMAVEKGKAASAEEPVAKGAKKTTPKPAPKTPDIKTLGDVPVAARNGTGDDPFAAIDKLDGLAYEEALERMSESQRKAYLAR